MIVVQSADLSVTQATDASTVTTSSPADYRLTVSNIGPDDATGVTVTDTLPAGLTILPSAELQPTTIVGDVLTYDLGTVAVGTSVPIVIFFTASQPGTYTNNAAVSGLEGDPEPANNTAAPLSIIVTSATPVPASADVSVAGSVAPSPATIGQDLTYTFIVANAGPDAAQDVWLTDTVPANTTFVSFAAPDGWTATTLAMGGNGTISATATALASAAGATFTLVVQVDDATSPCATIADTAAVSSSTADPSNANNSAVVTTTVATPPTPVADLEVTTVGPPKPVSVGQPLTLTTTVTDHGPAAATGLTLIVTVPTGRHSSPLPVESSRWTVS